MTLNEFITQQSETQRGQKVKFLESEIKSGPVVVMKQIDTGKAFVLEKSLNDFMLFKKWIGKEAVADFKQTGKSIRIDKQKYPLVQVRVKKNDEDLNSEDKDKETEEEVF